MVQKEDIVRIQIGLEWSSGIILRSLDNSATSSRGPTCSLSPSLYSLSSGSFTSSSSSFSTFSSPSSSYAINSSKMIYILTVSHIFHHSLFESWSSLQSPTIREERKNSRDFQLRREEKWSKRRFIQRKHQGKAHSSDLVNEFNRLGHSISVSFFLFQRDSEGKGEENKREGTKGNEKEMEGKGEVLFISPSHLDVALIRVPLSSLSRTLYLSFNEKDWVLSPIRRNENIQVGDSISILGLGNFLSLSLSAFSSFQRSGGGFESHQKERESCSFPNGCGCEGRRQWWCGGGQERASGGRCILHPITQENNGVRESELLCGM